ncbi:MAG TPA: hypothetical protein VGJ78_25760 [Vicinamibacterales bacterium]
MLQKLVLSALLVTMPFAGIRVICVDPPVDASAATTQTAADDCGRICARHHQVSSDTNGSNCILTADACALLAFASTIGVGPEQPSTAVGLHVSPAPADAPRRCLDPALARPFPPPKPQVLHDRHHFAWLEDLAHECGLSLARATALV